MFHQRIAITGKDRQVDTENHNVLEHRPPQEAVKAGRPELSLRTFWKFTVDKSESYKLQEEPVLGRPLTFVSSTSRSSIGFSVKICKILTGQHKNKQGAGGRVGIQFSQPATESEL